MFWSCYGNCTKGVPDDYRTLYRAAGVTHILGFNEPDNSGQSHLSPAHAAASGFAPPLTLVSPAMTHWTLNGSVWLDEFFGNCSDVVKDCDPSLVKYVAFHDYSASAGGIVAKADAAFQRYGNARRIRCSLTALTTALTTALISLQLRPQGVADGVGRWQWPRPRRQRQVPHSGAAPDRGLR